jgi:hypothetical protein
MKNVLSDTLNVRYDEALRSVLVIHPDEKVASTPLVRINSETLDMLNFSEAAQFLGERLLFLIPALRERYAEEISKLSKARE